MLDNKKIIGTDYQLTFRMILTGFLLLLAYMALFSLLLFTGIPIFLVLIFGVGMVFFQSARALAFAGLNFLPAKDPNRR